MVELVPASDTLRKIQVEYGVTGSYHSIVCVTLGMLFNLSVPVVLISKVGENSTYFIETL